MKLESLLLIVAAVISLLLAIGFWHRLYEGGGVLRQYAGPLWLATSVVSALYAYRASRRRL